MRRAGGGDRGAASRSPPGFLRRKRDLLFPPSAFVNIGPRRLDRRRVVDAAPADRPSARAGDRDDAAGRESARGKGTRLGDDPSGSSPTMRCDVEAFALAKRLAAGPNRRVRPRAGGQLQAAYEGDYAAANASRGRGLGSARARAAPRTVTKAAWRSCRSETPAFKGAMMAGQIEINIGEGCGQHARTRAKEPEHDPAPDPGRLAVPRAAKEVKGPRPRPGRRPRASSSSRFTPPRT